MKHQESVHMRRKDIEPRRRRSVTERFLARAVAALLVCGVAACGDVPGTLEPSTGAAGESTSPAESIGMVAQPIINGAMTSATNTPFVELTRAATNANLFDTCSGTLVSPTQVLTAKHCFANAYWSAGTAANLGSVASADSAYTNNGHAGEDIVGVAMRNDGYTFTFFSDGKYSASILATEAGWDLGAATGTFTVPAGKTAAKIVGMEYGSDGKLYTWFNDNTYTVGKETAVDSYNGPRPFTVNGGLAPYHIRAIAILPYMGADFAVTWMDDGTYGLGSIAALGSLGTATYVTPSEGWSSTPLDFSTLMEVTRNWNNGTYYAFYDTPLDEVATTVDGNGYSRNVVSTVLHPTLDVAIAKLDSAEPTAVTPAVGLAYLSTPSSAPGHTAFCVGWGRGVANDPNSDAFRAGFMTTGSIVDSNQEMNFTPYCNSSGVCTVAAPGDSGGPCLAAAYGYWWVYGVDSRERGLPATQIIETYADGFRSWFRTIVPTSASSQDAAFSF